MGLATEINVFRTGDIAWPPFTSSEEPSNLKTAPFVCQWFKHKIRWSGYESTGLLQSLSTLTSALGSPGSPFLTFNLNHNHPSITGPEATAGALVTAKLEFCIPSPCGCRKQTGLGKHQAWTLHPEGKQLPKQNHANNFPAGEES